MAIVAIARGPWSIDTVSITSTTRTPEGMVAVIAAGVSYILTIAEAVQLGVTIPQIPPVLPNSVAGSVVPNTGILVLGLNSITGKLIILAFGQAATDAAIVAQVGADALYADGSVYLSVLAGAGTFWLKKNDVWTNAV